MNVPNEEGLIPRVRKVKKTIEEINEKGKISKIVNYIWVIFFYISTVSKDVMVEEIYYEKKEKTVQSQPIEKIDKADKNKPAPKKGQPNIT